MKRISGNHFVITKEEQKAKGLDEPRLVESLCIYCGRPWQGTVCTTCSGGISASRARG